MKGVSLGIILLPFARAAKNIVNEAEMLKANLKQVWEVDKI